VNLLAIRVGGFCLRIVHGDDGNHLPAWRTIDKYIVDAVMALFGVPVPSDDSAVQAICAAPVMIERVKRIRPPDKITRRLRIRIGINTESLVGGDLGSQGHREYTALAILST